MKGYEGLPHCSQQRRGALLYALFLFVSIFFTIEHFIVLCAQWFKHLNEWSEVMNMEQEINTLAEEIKGTQKILTALGDEMRQHLILVMMQSSESPGFLPEGEGIIDQLTSLGYKTADIDWLFHFFQHRNYAAIIVLQTSKHLLSSSHFHPHQAHFLFPSLPVRLLMISS